jgi:uncharacterized protein (TIGR01777 family)
VLSRTPAHAPWKTAPWDAATPGPWATELDGADVVINLAGRNVNCRYTPENRRLIKESRVHSTRVVGEAIARAHRPPKVWLQASTATIYAHTFGPAHDESGEIGGKEPGVPETWRFSIDVATSWERALDEARTPNTRKVKLRSAMTMSPDRDGVFDTLLRLVRFGLGGRAGDGRQYVSWIHEEDFVRAIYWLIERQNVEGAVNLSAPEPLPNADFMCVLREAWGVSIGLPAAEWMLEIGARVIRTETELILKSRRVVPGRLLREGFQFRYPDWRSAAKELCERWRALGGRAPRALS